MPKTKRHSRKRYNVHNSIPAIQPNPTLDINNIDKLPKIILDCQANLSTSDINKLKNKLNFTDHRDLRKLYGIRIVDPNTIKLPSKESTTGYYKPGNIERKPEIWLSSELIKGQKGVEGFVNKVTYKDKLFEVLFHEIGHHKATLSHSVGKFENEAYAEKYMLAYRKLWRKYYGPSKIYIKVFKFFFKFISYILIAIFHPFRNRNDELNLIYRNIRGEITFKELVELMGFKENNSEKKKRKWTHPLSKKKYRDRFKLPDR